MERCVIDWSIVKPVAVLISSVAGQEVAWCLVGVVQSVANATSGELEVSSCTCDSTQVFVGDILCVDCFV